MTKTFLLLLTAALVAAPVAAQDLGAPIPQDQQVELYRMANRVPLLFQRGACGVTEAVMRTPWRNYEVSQPKGGLPVGPMVLLVHIASVWVPFTSESKEAIAHYPEIIKEMRLALQECGRRVGGPRRLRRRRPGNPSRTASDRR